MQTASPLQVMVQGYLLRRLRGELSKKLMTGKFGDIPAVLASTPGDFIAQLVATNSNEVDWFHGILEEMWPDNMSRRVALLEKMLPHFFSISLFEDVAGSPEDLDRQFRELGQQHRDSETLTRLMKDGVASPGEYESFFEQLFTTDSPVLKQLKRMMEIRISIAMRGTEPNAVERGLRDTFLPVMAFSVVGTLLSRYGKPTAA